MLTRYVFSSVTFTFQYCFQLRKAYFRQVEEIRSLKEQIGLKDKRIRQLEDEVVVLRRPGIKTQGESEC